MPIPVPTITGYVLFWVDTAFTTFMDFRHFIGWGPLYPIAAALAFLFDFVPAWKKSGFTRHGALNSVSSSTKTAVKTLAVVFALAISWNAYAQFVNEKGKVMAVQAKLADFQKPAAFSSSKKFVSDLANEILAFRKERRQYLDELRKIRSVQASDESATYHRDSITEFHDKFDNKLDQASSIFAQRGIEDAAGTFQQSCKNADDNYGAFFEELTQCVARLQHNAGLIK
jgi:hypothetical protein